MLATQEDKGCRCKAMQPAQLLVAMSVEILGPKMTLELIVEDQFAHQNSGSFQVPFEPSANRRLLSTQQRCERHAGRAPDEACWRQRVMAREDTFQPLIDIDGRKELAHQHQCAHATHELGVNRMRVQLRRILPIAPIDRHEYGLGHTIPRIREIEVRQRENDARGAVVDRLQCIRSLRRPVERMNGPKVGGMKVRKGIRHDVINGACSNVLIPRC